MYKNILKNWSYSYTALKIRRQMMHYYMLHMLLLADHNYGACRVATYVHPTILNEAPNNGQLPS